MIRAKKVIIQIFALYGFCLKDVNSCSPFFSVLTFTYFAFGLCLLFHEKLRAVTQLFPSTHISNSMVCCGESLPNMRGEGGVLKEHVAGDI